MATRQELTKAYARGYQRADKKAKGVMLDDCAQRRVVAGERPPRYPAGVASEGRAGDTPRKPQERKFSYDALKVLEEVWTQDGEPCGKYLAAVMDDTVDRLLRFGELGRVA